MKAHDWQQSMAKRCLPCFLNGICFTPLFAELIQHFILIAHFSLTPLKYTGRLANFLLPYLTG
jgi:hypothetical protein